ncbi:DUF732 domain-containing protein [Mycobacterium sp. Lab-001]|uniref:DUF732 domain-containing protein n=1 Tax=Mycobacterium sp. Lab-001 TaxID=3410136 RepID=UPI003D16FDAA
MSTTTTVAAAVTSHAGALVTALVVLTGSISVSAGAAAADPNQDAHFLDLLEQEQIPALKGVPSLISTAHKVCHELDGGMAVDSLVDDMKDHALINPSWRGVPERRVISTVTRFITASVEAYCPVDRSKIVSITAAAGQSGAPAHPVSLRARVLPLGGLTPDPPDIPAPPPDVPPLVSPPRPVAAPPPPKRLPSPQRSPALAQAPQPGGGIGDDGANGSGGGGGEGAAPVPPSAPMSPGWVRLAP